MMKKNLKTTAFLMPTVKVASTCVLLLFMVSCQKNIKNDFSENVVEVDWENEEKELMPFSDEFCDFELIPFENKLEAQLGKIVKLVVTDSAYYVWDQSQNARILAFNLDGSYRRNIGMYGHSNAEYSYIQDFSATEQGDTIAVLGFNDVKYYGSNGRHLFNLDLNSLGGSALLLDSGGFWLGSFHRYKDDRMLARYDTKGDITGKWIETDTLLLNFITFVQDWENIQRDGNQRCVYDPYSSTFYIFDKDNPSEMTSYTITSPTMFNEERCRKQSANGLSFNYKGDEITSFIFAEGFITGYVKDENSSPCNFSLNLADKTLKLKHFDSLDYGFDAYHDGYYYKFFSADAIMDYALTRKPHFKVVHDLLKDALEPIKDTVSEDDNYYLLRMRRKRAN